MISLSISTPSQSKMIRSGGIRPIREGTEQGSPRGRRVRRVDQFIMPPRLAALRTLRLRGEPCSVPLVLPKDSLMRRILHLCLIALLLLPCTGAAPPPRPVLAATPLSRIDIPCPPPPSDAPHQHLPRPPPPPPSPPHPLP